MFTHNMAKNFRIIFIFFPHPIRSPVVLCDSVDINSRRASVIVSVVVLHVTCLFCKLCNIFGVSDKDKVLRMKLECIINIGHGKVTAAWADDELCIDSLFFVYSFAPKLHLKCC